MIVSLLLIIYTLFTTYISGIVFLYIFSKFIRVLNLREDFAFACFSGLCWIAILISIQHIFFPVGIFSHLLIWFINIIAWSTNSAYFSNLASQQVLSFKNKTIAVYVLYFLFLAGAVINIMARPAVGDAADYHFQAIRWMEEYKVVPGVGNVRRQLGNNSNWFLLNAFFGFSFTGLRSVYVLNACLLLIACVFFSDALEKFLRGKAEKYFIIKSVILLYLGFTVFRRYVGAVTNDYVITVMILYVFTMLLETSGEEIFSRLMLIFFIAVMVTFKLSALPMLLLAGLILFSLVKQLRTRHVFVFAVLMLLLFIPWVYTNVMNCGYLVFPMSNPDLFDVDWKMRRSVLEWEVMANLAWARVPFTDVGVSSRYVFAQWFPLWIKSLDGFSIFLMASAIISTSFMGVLFSIRTFHNRIFEVIKAENFYIAITGAVALFLWFTHGPTPRFIFGYLIFLLAAQFWLISSVFPSLQKRVLSSGKHLFLLLAIIFFITCVPFLLKNFTMSSFATNLVMPHGYNQVKVKELRLREGFVNVPEDDGQCWDSPLPCTSEPDTGMIWRGAKMEEGFKIYKRN